MKEATSLEPATARRVTGPGQDCEILKTELGDLAVRQAALENEGDDHIEDGVPLPSKAPLILKAMYYWVISRR